MRRTLLAVAVAGVFAATSAFAQDEGGDGKVHVVGQTDDTPMNAIGVQYHSNLTLTPGVGYSPGVTLVYERAFSDMMSLAVQPGLYFGGIGTTFGLDLDLRFHLMGESMNGLYVGPTAGFWLTSVPVLGTAPGFDVGAIIGYSYLINNMIQIGAGVGVTFNGLITPAGLGTSVSLPIRVTVAYAF